MRLQSQEPAQRPMPHSPPILHRPCAHADPAIEETDARDFEAFAQAQDALDIEAALWASRRRNGLDAQGQAAWQSWLHADPRHAAAFDGMNATLKDLQQGPRPSPRLTPTMPAAPGPANPGRRQWLHGLFPQAAMTGMACVALTGGWLGWEHWRQIPVFDKTYVTLRGQQLIVTLPDSANAGGRNGGSKVELDTATQLQARLYRDRREIHLIDGQAMFSVHPDAKRPLHVWAGPLRITVVGTRFSVRHTASGLNAGHTVVSVEEGRVRVAQASLSEPSVELAAGQTVVADGNGRISAVATVLPSAVAAWREGRISFDQTPLGDAVAEFQRYGLTNLVVLDPAVAALPVGGSYSLRQWQHFAETLPHVLPVRLVRRGAVTEVVAQ